MKNIFLIFFGFLLLSGCKKYPEDDVFMQWKRPEKRLINGSPWTFSKLFENDLDISTMYQNDSSYVKEIQFWRKEEFYSVNLTGVCGSCGFSPIGGYDFGSKNKYLKLRLTYIPDFGNYGFIYNNQIEWKIRSIDKEDLILEAEFNGKSYRIEFTN